MEALTQQSLQTVMCQQLLAQFPSRSSKLHPTISLGDLASWQLYSLPMLSAAQLRLVQAVDPRS